MNETWKPVPGFDAYEASDHGRIRKRTGEIVQTYMRGVYRCVSLGRRPNRRTPSVHGVIAMTFHGARPANTECAHLDGNPVNNRADNLRWVTKKENQAHKRTHGTAKIGGRSHLAKLTDEQAVVVRDIIEAGVSANKLSTLLGMSPSTISDIANRVSFA